MSTGLMAPAALLVAGALGAAVLVRPGRPAVGRPPAEADRRWRTRLPARPRSRSPTAVAPASAAAVAERVAALLQAGASPEDAWGTEGSVVVPSLLAVRRVVERCGAPPVPALQACAVALWEEEDAKAAVRVATAGARTSARIVGWLPVGGLLLGWLLGAPPWAALFGSSWGRVSALLGLVLLLLGRWWSARLVAGALRTEPR